MVRYHDNKRRTRETDLFKISHVKAIYQKYRKRQSSKSVTVE